MCTDDASRSQRWTLRQRAEADRFKQRYALSDTWPVLLASWGAFLSFYLLFPVLPLVAKMQGASPGAAGWITTTFMAATGLVQPVSAAALRRFAYGPVVGSGALAMAIGSGLPAICDSLGACFAAVTLRGIGFGALIVATVGLIGEVVVDPSRRSAMIGLYGGVVGVAGIFGSAGTWIFYNWGLTAVSFLAALAPLTALACMIRMRLVCSHNEPNRSLLRGSARPGRAGVLMVGSVEFTSTLCLGVILTYLPLAAGAAHADAVSISLVAQQAASTLGRWWSGASSLISARREIALPAAVIVSVFSVLCLVSHDSLVILVGMTAFGLSFGFIQTITLDVLLGMLPAARASLVWNLLFDGGLCASGAIGALVLGLSSYSTLVFVTAGAFALTLPSARISSKGLRRREP